MIFLRSFRNFFSWAGDMDSMLWFTNRSSSSKRTFACGLDLVFVTSYASPKGYCSGNRIQPHHNKLGQT